MRPWKSRDYFIKVSFYVVVDMYSKARSVNLVCDMEINFIDIKNTFVMKNLTNFHKTVETGIDPRLRGEQALKHLNLFFGFLKTWMEGREMGN